MKRRAVFVWLATAWCMLIVRFASAPAARSITLSRLWVLTLKRTGPLGEAPVFGT